MLNLFVKYYLMMNNPICLSLPPKLAVLQARAAKSVTDPLKTASGGSWREPEFKIKTDERVQRSWVCPGLQISRVKEIKTRTKLSGRVSSTCSFTHTLPIFRTQLEQISKACLCFYKTTVTLTASM